MASSHSIVGNKRIKVLIVVPSLHQGGVERQVAYLVKSLDRECYEIHLGYFKNINIFYETLRHDSDHCHLMGHGKKTSYATFRDLCRLIRRLQPDILHLFTDSANFLGGASCFFTKSPNIIYSVRNTKSPWFYYPVYRVMQRFADLTIVNSKGIKRELLERAHYSAETVHIIPNFLDTTAFAPGSAADKSAARRELGLRGDDLIFATVGRLSFQKNQLGTIRAIQSLRQAGKLPDNFRMLLVGSPWDKSYSRTVREQVYELEQAGICSLRSPIQNVAQLYKAVDGIFQPSHFEGMSNVVMEAMACGIVVALSQEGDSDELIADKKNGISFVVQDEHTTARGLERLIAVCADPHSRAELGAAARRHVCERFSMQSSLAAVQAIYDQLCHQPVSKPAIASEALS